MKKGFTLIEMLVASLLMGILITILTMVFNSSSMAWRTGKASVADLDSRRIGMSKLQHQAENALPRLKRDGQETATGYYVTGAWSPTSSTLRKRSVGNLSDEKPITLPANVWTHPAAANVSVTGSASSGGGASTYKVGVKSAGPDGLWDTSDDITTLPEKKQ